MPISSPTANTLQGLLHDDLSRHYTFPQKGWLWKVAKLPLLQDMLISMKVTGEREVKEMNVLEAIGNRFSVRQYVDTAIPAEHMKTLFEALRLAPSANNSQNWEFVFVDDLKLKRRLISACFHQRFVGECSYFIAGIADPSLKWHMVDITIAFTNFTLQATELGYGTCWIGAFDETRVKEVLEIPKERKVVICMTFGKPVLKPLPRARKAAEEFVYFNSYGHNWKIS